MIRKAQISDIDEILAIEKRVFKDPWTRASLMEELKLKKDRLAFVDTSEKIISYIMIRTWSHEAQILNFAVDLSYQHRGYGKSLLDFTLTKLGDQREVYLEVRASNLTALKIYRDFNFEEIGIRKKYYADGEDAIVMKRSALNDVLV